MKKLFTIIFILITGVAKISAQEWAPIGAEWHYNVGDGLQPPTAEYEHYKVTKDTVFAGRNCRKIEGTWYRYKNAEVVKLQPKYTYKSADTVYFYHNRFSKYVPVYIFNVKAGDTLTFYYPERFTSIQNSTYRVIVDSVNTLTIDSLPLQQVNYSRHFGDSTVDILPSAYIEKIGSLNIFFDPTDWIQTGTTHNYIRCYSDNNISEKFVSTACDYRETIAAKFSFVAGSVLGLADTLRLKQGDTLSLSYMLSNTGNMAFSGKVQTNVRFSGNSTPDTAINPSSVIVQPGGQTLINADVIIKNNNLQQGATIVVVWPTGAGVISSDTFQKLVYIDETSGIFATNNALTQVRFSPNPANDFITIENTDPKAVIRNVEFVDANGRMVENQKWDAFNNKINISGFPAGVYFINIYFNDGSSGRYKLLKTE